jgi:ankyrin repeat protein
MTPTPPLPRLALALFSLVALSGTQDTSWSPLHKAIRNGDAQTVRRLLRTYGGGPNARGPGGMTPLMLAVAVRPEMAALLLDSEQVLFEGVDIRLVDDQGRDALIHAVSARNYAIAKTLVEHHSADVKQTDRTGRSAFDYAVQQDHFTAKDLDRMRFLEQAMWNGPAFHGWGREGTSRPPTIAEVAQDLCAKRLSGWDLRARLAMVFATIREKATPAGKREAALCAARAGVDLLPLETAGALGLHQEVADDRGYTQRWILLLESGYQLPPRADLSADIAEAVRRGIDGAAMALLDKNHARNPNQLGRALMSAAEKRKGELVERLLAAGAAVEGYLEYGNFDTPLMRAARSGCRRCVEALLAANASLYPGSHPSESLLVQTATAEVRPLIEKAMRAHQPDAAVLAEEERAVATAAFAAMLAESKYDPAQGVSLGIRNVQHAWTPPPVPGIVPRINLESFLWDSPAKVQLVARTTRVDTRPSDYPDMSFGSGTLVFLEKRDGKWIVLEVRPAPWVE